MNQQLLAKELLSTGWQSWSSRRKGRRLQFGLGRVPPVPDDSWPQHNPENMPRLKPPIRGWCSWYAFGPKIDEKKILAQTQWFANHKELAVDHILIDDGYARWGDWLDWDTAKFPSGPRSLAIQIKRLGLKPGIWLAPFLAHPKSKLVAEHPDWLLRNGNRPVIRTVFSGWLPAKMYILNIGNQQAQKHLQSVIEYLVEDCGFELLKPDFLYTIYHKNSAMSESAILLHNFLRSIKENHPNVYTLACGCPLIPAVGAVDSIRIGPDTIIPHFDGLPLLANWFHAKRLRQVVDNIEARSWTRTFWNLDPDAFVCRPTIGLSEQQIHSLAQAVRSAKGNIFLGDNMIKLSQEHVEKFIMPLLN